MEARNPRTSSRRRLLATAAVTAGAGLLALGARHRGVRAWRRLTGACGDGPSPPPSGWTVHRGERSSARLGRVLRHIVALPPGAPPGLPVALCLHPRGCNARWVVDALRLQDHVALEVRAGMAPFALVAMDSGGRWWRPHADGGDPLAEAMEALLPWARERYDLGPRVALLGWSMGGLGVLQSPVTVPHRVEALVATSPALFLSSRVWPRDPEGPYAGPAQFEALDPLRHPSTLAGVPLRLDCGDLDPFAAGAEALLASLRGHAEGGLQPGCHDEAFWHRVAGAQARFLARHLAG